MNVKTWYGLGVMSGTSLDGVDICYVKFDVGKQYKYKIICSNTFPYPENWEQKLRNAFKTDEEKLKKFDIQYGEFLGGLIQEFIDQNKITDLDFVASHGHTIFHKPEEGYTLQIGNGQVIANTIGYKVICDFRTQDVQLSGQGAPLVPIGDDLLFSSYKYCLNLGGFANVSYRGDDTRVAFDICPVNIVLNHYARKLDLLYDDKGKLSSQGKIHKELLYRLNSLEFYDRPYPKSLGLEWVIQHIFPLIDSYNLNIRDVLRTFVEHVAMQLSNIIEKKANVLVTGGGAFHIFLMERITEYHQKSIELPEVTLINFKEALIFSFLGLLKVNNQINVLSSVTGARKDHSSGIIFTPQ